MTPDVIAAIALPLSVNAVVIAFYAGVTWSMLKNHDRRLDVLEQERRDRRES